MIRERAQHSTHIHTDSLIPTRRTIHREGERAYSIASDTLYTCSMSERHKGTNRAAAAASEIHDRELETGTQSRDIGLLLLSLLLSNWNWLNREMRDYTLYKLCRYKWEEHCWAVFKGCSLCCCFCCHCCCCCYGFSVNACVCSSAVCMCVRVWVCVVCIVCSLGFNWTATNIYYPSGAETFVYMFWYWMLRIW